MVGCGSCSCCGGTGRRASQTPPLKVPQPPQMTPEAGEQVSKAGALRDIVAGRRHQPLFLTATVAAMYYSYYMLPDGTYCLAPPPPGIDVATYYSTLPAGVTVSSSPGVTTTVPPPPGTTPPPPPTTAESSSGVTSTTTTTRYVCHLLSVVAAAAVPCCT